MPALLPLKLPAALAGSSTSAVPAGSSYDVLIGGYGFRLATDTNNPFRRYLDPLPTQRPDSSIEANANTLEPIPWAKGQTSFHAGAGQVNLEQYSSRYAVDVTEPIAQFRYSRSLGMDVWTPGKIQRLPDTTIVGLSFTAACLVAGTVDGADYAVVGGAGGKLSQVSWPSGIDSAATVTAITLGVTGDVVSLATDGVHYYALVAGTGNSYVMSGSLDSTATPSTLYTGAAAWAGVLGWSKERLMLGCLNSLYELDLTAASAALPTPNYTHPVTDATFTAIGESPTGVLAALLSGRSPSVVELTLDSSGATPTLTGGATVLVLPPGETIHVVQSYLASFLVVGTDKGLRVGTFDTYSGALTVGPLTLTTGSAVQAVAGRDRFVFAGYTDAQPDGTTGLARVDLSMTVDGAGRAAWAPDLRPPSTAATGKGAVTGVALAPASGRLLFTATDGLHVEGDGPGGDGEAWLETSRISYFTGDRKLFTRASIHGDLSTDQVSVTALRPYGVSSGLGTFGYATKDSEFALPSDPTPWMQLRFSLLGPAAILNSYQVRAIPAPSRTVVSEFRVACFLSELDRWGRTASDGPPWNRWSHLYSLAVAGGAVRFVEFTNSGTRTSQAVIDALEWDSDSPPQRADTAGGYISLRLREI